MIETLLVSGAVAVIVVYLIPMYMASWRYAASGKRCSQCGSSLRLIPGKNGTTHEVCTSIRCED